MIIEILIEIVISTNIIFTQWALQNQFTRISQKNSVPNHIRLDIILNGLFVTQWDKHKFVAINWACWHTFSLVEVGLIIECALGWGVLNLTLSIC